MNQFNRVTSGVLLGLLLASGTHSSAVQAETYYVPHRIYLPAGEKIQLPNMVRLNNKGEFVAISGGRKPLYWSKYDNPSFLSGPDGLPLNQNTYSIDINNNGDILAATFGQMVKWAPTTHDFSYFNLSVHAANLKLKLNDHGDALVSVKKPIPFNYYEIYRYNIYDNSGYFTNASVGVNADFTNLTINGLNNNGVGVFRTQITQFKESVIRADDSVSILQGYNSEATNPYSYWSQYRAINDSNDVVGNEYITYDNGTTGFDCVYTNLDDSSARQALDTSHITPFGYNHNTCLLMDINNNGTAIGYDEGYYYERIGDYTTTYKDYSGFLYFVDSQQVVALTDLIRWESDVIPSDIENLQLIQINDNGDIIGYSMHKVGVNYYPLDYYYFTAHDDTPPPAPEPVTITLDNGTLDNAPTYSNWVNIGYAVDFLIPIDSFTWESSTSVTGYIGDDYMQVAQGDGFDKEFEWSTVIEKTASYDVIVKLPTFAGNGSGNDSAATYELYAGSSLIGTFIVDQSNVAIEGQSLGIYAINADVELTIKLKGSGQGDLIADGIEIVEQL